MNLITFHINEPLLSKKDKELLDKEKNIYIGDWCLEEENIFLSKKKNTKHLKIIIGTIIKKEIKIVFTYKKYILKY